EEGTIAGNVYLRGSGDPSLATQDLVDLATELAHRGVRKIAGGVVVEERAASNDELGYAALSMNRNTFSIRVRPAIAAGQRPEVTIDPPSEYLVVENRATTTARGRSRIRVETRAKSDATVITIAGSIPESHAPVTLHRRPLHPAVFAAASLSE